MSRKTQQLLLLAPSIVIGLGVTVAVLYAMANGLNDILGTIVMVVSLLIALALGVVGMGVSYAMPDAGREEDLALKMLRASQRAMVEELDEVVTLLGEIRNALRNTGGED